MIETSEQATARQSPLREAHERAGATFVARDNWLVPAAYGHSFDAEYEAVRGAGGAGLLDFSPRGRILLGGSEAVMFLNGLITNDVKALAENAWMTAAFPNAQGRLLAFARVLRRAEGFLIDTESATRERVFKALERFTLAGDFRVEDVTEQTATLSAQGARAAELVGAVLGIEAAQLEHGRVIEARLGEATIDVIRATHTGEDGFDLFVGAERAAELWDALVRAGGVPIGEDALEVLRVEAGLPRYGADVDETNVVLEAGIDEAVSFTKGCYVGQEIIARIHWRGHVAKKLSGLVLGAGGEAVSRGAKLKTADGAKDAGRVTSVARSPRLGQTIALGYVRYDYLAPGTKLIVAAADEGAGVACEATVAALPLVRGSWHEGTAGAGPQTA